MKVGDLEKEILESRQKIDYYRTKMQELVSIFQLLLVNFYACSMGIKFNKDIAVEV